MIIVDRSTHWGWGLGKSAHVLSTLPGAAGSEELAAFARRLGLKPSWLQKAGTETEHYDLTERRYNAALELGAKLVDRRTMVVAIRAKRLAR